MNTLIERILILFIILVFKTAVYAQEIIPNKMKWSTSSFWEKSIDTLPAETRGQEWNKIDTFTIGPKNCLSEKPYDQVLHYTKFYAKKYSVPEKYLFKLLKLETGFKLGDTSYNHLSKHILKNPEANGPFQVVTSTGKLVWKDSLKTLSNKAFRKKLRTDIEFNIHTGVKYIYILHEKYKTWLKVFSVYNQGVKGAKHINTYARSIVL